MFKATDYFNSITRATGYVFKFPIVKTVVIHLFLSKI